MAESRGFPTRVAKLSDFFDTDVGTAVNDLVRLNGVNSVTAISDNLAATIPNGVFGICISKPTTTRAEVLFSGLVTGFAGLTPSAPLFISTGGVPTHTQPVTGILQQIGFATRTTDIFFDIKLGVEL